MNSATDSESDFEIPILDEQTYRANRLEEVALYDKFDWHVLTKMENTRGCFEMIKEEAVRSFIFFKFQLYTAFYTEEQGEVELGVPEGQTSTTPDVLNVRVTHKATKQTADIRISFVKQEFGSVKAERV
eukprot:TRINITY_DN67966_c0_g1_i1.p1 TRINITY_DN67966_c0_g1~~TRINITY_DN67966_c0_g1_i1.p1  ORF type:complete len:129 (-),score=20.93 TRINITY_DN67966_c0_g1_i1:214-600(-)